MFATERAVAGSSPRSVCFCVFVSHRCASLLVRVWALDVWGELVPSKTFNPTIPSSQGWASSVYVMFVGSGLMRWASFYSFLKFLFG